MEEYLKAKLHANASMSMDSNVDAQPPMIAKRRLRQEIRERLKELDSKCRAEWSTEITSHVLALREFNEAKSLALFASLPSEPETRAILDAAIQAGKTTALPWMEQESSNLHFYQITDLDRQTATNSFGVSEPIPEICQRVATKPFDLVLIPGLAFDAQGHRLGRGKGYYDRFLQNLPPSTKRIGLFFSVQRCDLIPTETHDQPLDCTVTEQGIHPT